MVTSVPKRPGGTIFSAEYRSRIHNKNLDNQLEITTLTTIPQVFHVVKPSNISRICSFTHMYYASVHSLVMSVHSIAPCPFTRVSCQFTLTCHVRSLSCAKQTQTRKATDRKKKNTANRTDYRIAQCKKKSLYHISWHSLRIGRTLCRTHTRFSGKFNAIRRNTLRHKIV